MKEVTPKIHKAHKLFFSKLQKLEISPQVSEPSLYSEDILTPFKGPFQPRATIAQTSPVKSPGFIPQLTPLSVLKKTAR